MIILLYFLKRGLKLLVLGRVICMNESFKIIDVKNLYSNKKKKEYYYVVLYSNLEYIIKVFISKDIYDFLKEFTEDDIYNIAIDSFLTKRYDNGKFIFNISADILKS